MGKKKNRATGAEFNCAGCDRPDGAEKHMVRCDNCRDWWHFGCAQVTRKTARGAWSCTACTSNMSQPNGAAADPAEAVLAVPEGAHTEQDRLLDEIKKMEYERDLIQRHRQLAEELARLRLEKGTSIQPEAQNLLTSARVASIQEDISTAKNTAPDGYYDPPMFDHHVPVNRLSPHARVYQPSWPQTSANTHQVQPAVLQYQASYAEPVRAYGPQGRLTHEHITARKSLGKDLPRFGGDPEEWPVFISNYNMTTEMCNYNDPENVLRLQKCLHGAALEHVKGLMYLPANVPSIMESLQERFGRPELIVDRLLGKIEKLPPVKMERMETLVAFGNEIHNACTVMKSAGLEDELRNSTTLRLVLERLPPSLKLEWASFAMACSRPTLETFDKWIGPKAIAAARMIPSQSKRGDVKHGRVNVHMNEGSSTTEKKCLVCKATCKSISACKEFTAYDVNERWQSVKKLHLCRLCLVRHKGGCKESGSCGLSGCTYRHHRLLHNPARLTAAPATAASKHAGGEQSLSHRSGEKGVLFRVVPVKLIHGEHELQTYALMDDGSSVTLLDRSLANELKLQGRQGRLCLNWTGGRSRVETDSMRTTVKISGIQEGADVYEAHDVRTVSNLGLPEQDLDMTFLAKKYPHLRDLDISSYSGAVPKMLIGSDNAYLASSQETAESGRNEPIAVRTRVGWSVHGKLSPRASGSVSLNYHACDCQEQSQEDLHQLVREAIDGDVTGIRGDPEALLSPQELRAVRIQESTTSRVGDRYQTGLLWAHDEVSLPESFKMAKRRALCTEKRYQEDPELRQKVIEIVKEYESLGYIRKLSPEEVDYQDNRTWYLPFFPAVNPNKPGKIRMVWDGAAKAGGVSLNSVLLKGPDVVVPLPQPLIRFRERKVCIWGDIRQMFHQVLVRPEDQQAQRFLFRESESEDFAIYVLRVLTFGASCSPSSAQYVKNLNARQFESSHPRAVRSILESHYVDDHLDSCDSISETIELAEQVRLIHANAGFHIRNFKSNEPEVEAALEGGGPELLNLDVLETTEKILGMWYDRGDDCFTYSVKFNKIPAGILDGTVVPTKREVLRTVMSVFDPNGHLANFTIHLRMLLQDIWRTGRGWDDKIPEDILQNWRKWLEMLDAIQNIKIPRCFLRQNETYEGATVQLHVFTDAGAEAYATVVYIRIENGSRVDVSQVGAKAKVAPLRLRSIPRLELDGALMGARFAQSIKQWLSVRVDRTFFYTDSTTVLHWIRSSHRRYHQYVAFRVSEIQEISDVSDWRWISTKMNVADEATKSSNEPDLDVSGRWFAGPPFLREPEDAWPVKNLQNLPGTDEEQVAPDAASNRVYAATEAKVRPETPEPENTAVELVGRHLIPLLTADELRGAEIVLYRIAQRSTYSAECELLKEGRPLPHDSPIYKLTPYLDENKLLRVDGRIESTELELDTCKPIILPRDHRITCLLVHHYHVNFKHQHHETTVNELRKRFHIPEMRVMVKKVAQDCLECKIRKAKPAIPRMGLLPKGRIANNQPPFTHTGVDYFGPVYVTVRRSSEKRWGVLFVCQTTRAVHIEVVNSLSANSCILAFRIFISRRGHPRVIYSDRGTNFIATERILREELQKMDQSALVLEFVSSQTEWRFNPPGAPHFGGSWERKVRSVKNALYECLPQGSVSEEVLRSALAEVENIVNSTPLTYLPLDSPESEALTPNHFLRGNSGAVERCSAPDDHPQTLKNDWKTSQKMIDRFWHRWINEFRPMMNVRSKWIDENLPLKEGSVVLIVDENNPRNKWPKGVVVSTIAGRDGRIRQASVKTSSGLLKRPVAKLVVLPVGSEEPSQTGLENVGNSPPQ